MPRRKKKYIVQFKVGGYGHTVSVMKRPDSQHLYLLWYAHKKPVWKSLKHSNHEKAEEEAKAVSATLLLETETGNAIAMALLCSRYLAERTPSKRAVSSRKEDRRRARVWEQYLGSSTDPMTIDRAVLDRYVRERRQRVRARSVESELAFLNAMLNWASEVSGPATGKLIPFNPIRGYRNKDAREKNPRRPIATFEHFIRTYRFADRADPQRRFRTLLGLVEALGWRVSALCQLRVCDFELVARQHAPHGRVLKRAATDKRGIEQWVPLSWRARREVDRLLRRHPAVGQVYLFPAPRVKGKCWSRFYAQKLHVRAQALAGGEVVGFHAYRRKWATERSHLPRPDVAAAGAWESVRTLDIYQQADPERVFAVVSEPRKLREVVRENRGSNSAPTAARGVASRATGTA